MIVRFADTLSGRTLTTSYGYDAASNRTSFIDPEGGISSYGYDSDSRLTSLASATSGSFSFTYDGLSRRTSITRPDGISANYTYDSLSRLLSVLDQTRKATLDGAAYTYDPAGNRLSRQDYRTGTMSNFAYDAIYQLLQVTQSGQPTETYSYDNVGNRLSSLGVSPYSYDSSNQLNSQPGVTYSYDANGNLISKTDASGTTGYSWDAENRLSSVTLPAAGGTVTYQYDPFGRRIEKVSPTGTTIYAYDGNNVVEELDGGGMAVARYTQGLGIDEPLAMYRGGASYYYNADGLGSITSLTNASGQIAATYNYDSFGKLTASTGTVTNPFRYTGREYGSDTGLYYYRARYYDSNVGRFISEDPIRWTAGINFYAYAFNDPVVFADPLGLICGCTYSISTGHFQCYGPGPGPNGGPYFIDTYGYSGYGTAQNNLAETDLPGRDYPRQGGPIPMGTWNFGEGYNDLHRGDPSFNLTPTKNVLIPPGRSGAPGSFKIHADSISSPGNASTGCVALDRPSRKRLAECHGGSLDVIP